jgi:hypothetical protein
VFDSRKSLLSMLIPGQEKVAARKRAKLAVKPEPKTNIASSGDAAVIDISD